MHRIIGAMALGVLLAVPGTMALAKTISDPNEASISHHDVRSATLVKPSAGHLSWKLVTWDTWGRTRSCRRAADR